MVALYTNGLPFESSTENIQNRQHLHGDDYRYLMNKIAVSFWMEYFPPKPLPFSKKKSYFFRVSKIRLIN